MCHKKTKSKIINARDINELMEKINTTKNDAINIIQNKSEDSNYIEIEVSNIMDKESQKLSIMHVLHLQVKAYLLIWKNNQVSIAMRIK